MAKLWTETEKEIVRRWYPLGGVLACAERLPGRTKGSIKSLSYKLGVHSNCPRPKKHSYVGTRTYRAWYSAKHRCRNPKHPYYGMYGGAGVRFSHVWDDFCEFLRNMGEAPSNAHQIDRIDPTRGYEPGNCRWVTPQQNAANTRSTNSTGFRGVDPLPSGRFRAQVRKGGRRVYLGVFNSAEAAAREYDRAATEEFGVYAMTNARLGVLK